MIEPKAGDYIWLVSTAPAVNTILVLVLGPTSWEAVKVRYKGDDGTVWVNEVALYPTDRFATDSEVLAAKLKGEI